MGLLAGTASLALMLGLAFASLGGLLRASAAAGRWTYADLAREVLGEGGRVALRLSIVLNNMGSMVGGWVVCVCGGVGGWVVCVRGGGWVVCVRGGG